jgi:hypothetical protein
MTMLTPQPIGFAHVDRILFRLIAEGLSPNERTLILAYAIAMNHVMAGGSDSQVGTLARFVSKAIVRLHANIGAADRGQALPVKRQCR